MRPPWAPAKVGCVVPLHALATEPPVVGRLVADEFGVDDIGQLTTDECPCKLTSRLMSDIGCPHAAMMHLASRGKWTPNDQRTHAREEDTTLFPLALKVADRYESLGETEHARKIRKVVGRLSAQHVVFERDYWSKDAVVPESLFGPHGLLEERLVGMYEYPIRIVAGLWKMAA